MKIVQIYNFYCRVSKKSFARFVFFCFLALVFVSQIFSKDLAKDGSSESPEVANLLQSAAETAKKLESEVSEQVSLLKNEAKAHYEKIKEDTEKQVQELKNSASKEVEKIKETTETQSKIILDEATKEVDEINKKISEESVEMKAKAAQKVLDIVDEAEKKSIELKRKAREDAILRNIKQGRPMLSFDQTPASVPVLKPWQKPVTVQWKQIFFSEFENSLKFMQKIIRDAETPEAIADFEKSFTAQLSWLDNTLTNTSYENDENYNKLTRKKTALDKVIFNQNRADSMLSSFYMSNASLKDKDCKDIRLMTLYEINSIVNQKANNNIIAMGFVDLTDDEIKSAIIQATKDYFLRTKKSVNLPPQLQLTPITPMIVVDKGIPQQIASSNKQIIPDLQGRLEQSSSREVNLELERKKALTDAEKFKRDAENANQLLAQINLDKNKVAKQLEEANKNLINAEVDLVKAQKSVEVAAKDSYELAKSKFKPMIEDKDKLNLDMSIKLAGSDQKLVKLEHQNEELTNTLTTTEMKMKLAKEQTEKAVQKIQEQSRLVKHLEAKSALIQAAADEKEREVEQYADVLRKAKVRLSERVADFAAQKKAWILEKSYSETAKMISDESEKVTNSMPKKNIVSRSEKNFLNDESSGSIKKDDLKLNHEKTAKVELEKELQQRAVSSPINLISSN